MAPDQGQIGDRRRVERRKGEAAFTEWRRKATAAFVLLSFAMTVGLYWTYNTRKTASDHDRDRQEQIAQQQQALTQVLIAVQKGRKTTLLKICDIDNRQNAAVRKILNRFNVDSSDFKAISCKKLVQTSKSNARP